MRIWTYLTCKYVSKPCRRCSKTFGTQFLTCLEGISGVLIHFLSYKDRNRKKMYLNYKDIILEEKPLIRKWNTTIANKKIEENIVTLKFWPKILHIAVCLKCSDFRSFMFWVVAVIVVHCLVFQTGIIFFFWKITSLIKKL